MTLERGFRRVLMVTSVALLSAATLFAVLLAASWSLQIRSEAQQRTQRETQLSAKGYGQKSGPATIGVTALAPRRWRVMLWSRWSPIQPDLRPLFVAPGFRSAGHENRRVFLAASDKEFANAPRAGQDTILSWVATVVPEPKMPPPPDSFVPDDLIVELLPERASEIWMHSWEVTSPSGEEYYVDSIYELNRAQIMEMVQMKVFLPGVAARRKTESAQTATSPTISLYVITAERDLTPIQFVRAAQGWRTPTFGSVHSPEPGIEVLNCNWEESNLRLAGATNRSR
jgi:hypothetical protein